MTPSEENSRKYLSRQEIGPLVPGAGLWRDRSLVPEAFSLELGVDPQTARIEVIRGLPFESQRRTLPWLIQREPESHIPNLASHLLRMLPDGLAFVGASFKDISLLENVRKLNPAVKVHSEPIVDGTDISQVQHEFASIPEGVGSGEEIPTVLVARHLLEHSSDLGGFFARVRAIVGEEGFVVLEVPDSRPGFLALDYSEIWDEHLTYFTASSLVSTVSSYGLRSVSLQATVSDGEAILVMVATSGRDFTPEDDLAGALQVSFRYLESLGSDASRSKGSQILLESGAILYGANHRAANFIDIFMPLGAPIHVLDDDPRKEGLYCSSRAIPVQLPERCIVDRLAPVFIALNGNRCRELSAREPAVLRGAASVSSVMHFTKWLSKRV